MKYTYLFIDLGTLAIPLLFSFHPKIRFYRSWGSLLPALCVTAAVFIAWDRLFTHMGIWSFNKSYISGITFFSLPAEEVLFFFCIPYACLFTYHCLHPFLHFSWNRKTEATLVSTVSFILLLTGILHYDRLYTLVTFAGTALLLLFLKWIIKVKWLCKACSVYTILVLPFFIVNGLLTGTWLPEPVVRYNPAENLGIRIGTIPVEDVVYGLSLFIMNLSFYSWFSGKKSLP